VRHRIQVYLQISFEKSKGMKGPNRCTSKLEQMVGATEEKAFSPKCKDSAHSQGAKLRREMRLTRQATEIPLRILKTK